MNNKIKINLITLFEQYKFFFYRYLDKFSVQLQILVGKIQIFQLHLNEKNY